VIATRASRPHYAAHLAPILERLPADIPDDVCLVASHRDLVTARREGFRHLILAQHGIGQSYTKPLPSYPGGKDNHDVGLFLVPNKHAADRWREAYAGAAIEVVGSPILDTLPRRVPDFTYRDVVAVSFHWNAAHTPEAGSAFRIFRDQVAQLAERFHVIGHGHPLRRGMPAFYERNGIEYVPDFADVCRRADVYVCDNSSTLYEFAATGRPVVVLNSPQYRGRVNHGLRFWEAACVGLNAWHGDNLGDVIERALQDPLEARYHREQALDIVYAYRTGGAQRAADAIVRWLEPAFVDPGDHFAGMPA
jgi:hypothetical protein